MIPDVPHIHLHPNVWVSCCEIEWLPPLQNCFYNNLALDEQLMNFSIWRENNVIFLFLWNPQIFKSMTLSWALIHNGSYTYTYFFRILSTIKMEFGQILACCKTNTFLECWRLKTSSRPFYGFVKTTMYRDLAIFNSWHLPFSVVSYSPFQKNQPFEPWHNWLLSNWSRLLNWTEHET